MNKYILMISILISAVSLSGQPNVPYLYKKPNIDGVADNFLPEFKRNVFNNIYKSNDNNPDIKSCYYYAYSSHYFYLYIEADADSIISRDRAYQNGDGFHLMFGKKQKTMAPTDEFYILGFSPQKSWCHKMIWYYNVDLSMKKLGSEVEFDTCEKNGKISFEILIPWGSIRPYHPWYEPAIGFNLCFVKTIGEREKNYYFIKLDERMQSEQSKRKYITLNFEPPLDHNTFYIQPLRANIKENNPAGIKIAGFSNKDTTNTLVAKIISGENFRVFRKKYIISIPKGDFTKKITFNDARLIPGGYKIFLRTNSEIGFEHSISVFPLIELQNYISNLDNMKSSISDGTYNTLLFYIENLEKELNELKYYETSYKIRKRINSIELYLHQINKGTDPLKHKKGVYRRAFQSKIDSTLRPYSIYIPENYSLTKKYPLLVYLHGSGDDDRVLNRTPKIEDNYIILAPNGRGTSNCFATEEAQTDIIESINDVIDNFRIDTSNIILSGFSMGGYGVYRTYYEHPDLFKAVAIISGHPNLAQKWIGKDQINFLEYKNMRFFKNTPMFIYHGRQDMNCPFELTEKLVQKLKQQGHNVTFVVNDTGHGSMTEADRKQYYLWLKGQID